MSEISETEIKNMTKEQNYLRGYADCKKDMSSKNLIEIPENATIGDVIKAVFPDWKIEHVRKMSGLDRYDINIDNFNRFSFYEDFWNSPYQPVKEAGCNTIQSYNNCKNCEFRQKHPTMQNTSLCLNRDSEHYGSFIDERHPDYENKNEECCSIKMTLGCNRTSQSDDFTLTEEKKDVACTYQETGCGSCEHQTNCPLQESEEKK